MFEFLTPCFSLCLCGSKEPGLNFSLSVSSVLRFPGDADINANDTLRNCFSQRRKGNSTQRIHKKRIPGAFAPYVLFA